MSLRSQRRRLRLALLEKRTVNQRNIEAYIKRKNNTNFFEGKCLFLAVEENSLFQVAEKVYESCLGSSYTYTYNTATIPISISESDKMHFPAIDRAFKDAAFDYDDNPIKDPYLQIAINPPKDEWGVTAVPPVMLEGNSHVGSSKKKQSAEIRIKINKSDFLKRLFEIYGSSVTVRVRGYILRTQFRRGRPIPLSYNLDFTSLHVLHSGATVEATIKFVPDFFTITDVIQGNFSIELGYVWNGLEPMTGRLELYQQLHSVFGKPEDVTITLLDGSTFKTHACILRAHSGFFDSMFKANMMEANTGIITLRDVNITKDIMQNFIRFLNEGSLLPIFLQLDACAGMLYLSHICDMPSLENGMKNVLMNKPENWFTINSAFKLLSMLQTFPREEYTGISRRIRRILFKRQRSRKFKANQKKYPELAKLILQENVEYEAILPVSDISDDELPF